MCGCHVGIVQSSANTQEVITAYIFVTLDCGVVLDVQYTSIARCFRCVLAVKDRPIHIYRILSSFGSADWYIAPDDTRALSMYRPPTLCLCCHIIMSM